MRYALFALICGLLVLPSHAASIRFERMGELDAILVEGTLNNGDGERFMGVLMDAVGRGGTPVVLFSSDGGSLDAGIVMGRAIHSFGLVTAVPPGLRCASACALAWTAGRRRLLSRSSRLGYHQAWQDGATGPVASATGSARATAYLAQIGATPDLMSFAIRARPDELGYLDPDLSRSLGLAVEWLDEPSARTAYAPAEPRAAVPLDDMPDDENLRRAIDNVRAAWRSGGPAKLVQASRACWRTVQRNGSARSFQYCIVLDVTAEYLFKKGRRSVRDLPPEQIESVNIRARARQARSWVRFPALLPANPLAQWGGRAYAVLGN